MTRFTDNNGAEWHFDERDRLARGGAGLVFRGTGADGTAVAVKRVRLPSPGVKPERRRERELRITERLVAAAGSGEDTGHLVLPLGHRLVDDDDFDDLFIVMPLADGSLAETLRHGPLAPAEGAEVVRQIAQGLVALASLSITHRDLKPGNVLRYGDTWKISDFGISRDQSISTDLFTLAGSGTDPYKAPEVWLGRPATAKSDLYALGVLAYVVFTGEAPFRGPDEADFRRQHLEGEPPLPPLDGLPPKLKRLVLRLLSKEPAGRPQDARAVCQEIDKFQERLRPNQDALVEAGVTVQERRMARAAAAGATAAQRAYAQGLRRQAIADLDEILAEAHDDIVEALPEAVPDRAAREIALGDFRVEIAFRDPIRLGSRPEDNRDVLHAVLHRPAENRVYAHLTCTAGEKDRLSWAYRDPSPLAGGARPFDSDAILEILRIALLDAT